MSADPICHDPHEAGLNRAPLAVTLILHSIPHLSAVQWTVCKIQRHLGLPLSAILKVVSLVSRLSFVRLKSVKMVGRWILQACARFPGRWVRFRGRWSPRVLDEGKSAHPCLWFHVGLPASSLRARLSWLSALTPASLFSPPLCLLTLATERRVLACSCCVLDIFISPLRATYWHSQRVRTGCEAGRPVADELKSTRSALPRSKKVVPWFGRVRAWPWLGHLARLGLIQSCPKEGEWISSSNCSGFRHDTN